MTDLRKKAEEVVRNSYVTNFDEHEGDTEFISDGRLVLLITEALTQTRLEAIEACAKVADEYAEDEKENCRRHRGHLQSMASGAFESALSIAEAVRKLGEGKL